MEEENPLETREQLEEVHEHAEGAEAKGQSWVRFLSISTAIIAVLAALASLTSGHYSDEALVLKGTSNRLQTQASDQWSYYQAKGIKHDVAAGFLALKPDPQGAARVKKLEDQQTEIKAKADEFEKEADAKDQESERDIGHHDKLAVAVTLFQIAIALSAIAALLRRRRVWLLSMAVAAAGLVYLVLGLR